VLCVGERQRVSTAAAIEHSIQELDAVLVRTLASGLAGPLIVAYEPAWAIGAMEPAPPEHVDSVCRALKDHLMSQGVHASSSVIYGGSAGPGLLTRLGRNVDGLFLGRFARSTDGFGQILHEAGGLVRSTEG